MRRIKRNIKKDIDKGKRKRREREDVKREKKGIEVQGVVMLRKWMRQRHRGKRVEVDWLRQGGRSRCSWLLLTHIRHSRPAFKDEVMALSWLDLV